MSTVPSQPALAASVRTATQDDAESIAKIWLEATIEVAQVEPIYRPAIGVEALTVRLRAALRQGSISAFVAEDGGAVVAYVTYEIRCEGDPFSNRRFLYVRDLDVLFAHRRRGLARVLYQYVENRARIMGIYRLELSIIARDERALHMWSEFGFEPLLVRKTKLLL